MTGSAPGSTGWSSRPLRRVAWGVIVVGLVATVVGFATGDPVAIALNQVTGVGIIAVLAWMALSDGRDRDQ